MIGPSSAYVFELNWIYFIVMQQGPHSWMKQRFYWIDVRRVKING